MPKQAKTCKANKYTPFGFTPNGITLRVGKVYNVWELWPIANASFMRVSLYNYNKALTLTSLYGGAGLFVDRTGHVYYRWLSNPTSTGVYFAFELVEESKKPRYKASSTTLYTHATKYRVEAQESNNLSKGIKMTTSNKTKQFAVRDANGNRWFARVGDVLSWAGKTYTLTTFDAWDGTANKRNDVYLHLRETGGERATCYARADVHFKLIRRAGTTVTKKKVAVAEPKPIKFISALAHGGGSLWLSVGEKYKVFLRNNESKRRFGVQELSEPMTLEGIDAREGYHMLRFNKATVATIAAPAMTKIGAVWERYFEKV